MGDLRGARGLLSVPLVRDQSAWQHLLKCGAVYPKKSDVLPSFQRALLTLPLMASVLLVARLDL